MTRSMQPAKPDDYDPFGCRGELEAALAQSELDVFDTSASGELTPPAPGPEAQQAAYELAVALGRCRLFGVNVGDLDGTLPAVMARAAADQLAAYLDQWTQDARRLGERWDQAEEPVEAEELCLELLEARMEAWAAWIALDEAVWTAQEERDPVATSLRTATDQLLDRLEAFDDVLHQQLPLLATAADNELLNNWRAALAEPYRTMPPWWLDGTLEAVAEQSYQQMLDELPRPIPAVAPKPVFLILEVYRQALESPLALAAKPEPAPQLNVVRWDSPDRKFVANLNIPGSPQETWILCFYTADGDPGRALAGQRVRLDGVEAQINEEGRATFSRHDLEQAAQRDLRLEVGSDQTVWELAAD